MMLETGTVSALLISQREASNRVKTRQIKLPIYNNGTAPPFLFIDTILFRYEVVFHGLSIYVEVGGVRIADKKGKPLG